MEIPTAEHGKTKTQGKAAALVLGWARFGAFNFPPAVLWYRLVLSPRHLLYILKIKCTTGEQSPDLPKKALVMNKYSIAPSPGSI